VKSIDFVRLLGLAAMWGAGFLCLRVAAPVLGILPTSFFRVLLGMLGLVAILLATRAGWDFKGNLKRCLLLGVINAGIPFAMYAIAAQWLPAGYLSVFNATTPLMGVLIGALFFAERLTLAKAGGVLAGLLGVAVLTGNGPMALSPGVIGGALACLVATACYGLGGFLAQRWIGDRGGLDSKLVAFSSQAGAVLFLLPLFGISAISHPPASWGGIGVWSCMAILGLFSTALAFILYFQLIATIGPVKVTTVTLLVPLFSVLWGALLLGEPLSWAYLQGGALIALALWLVLKSPPRVIAVGD
jgi:drug/metabolite transporter (DMT)-like permease